MKITRMATMVCMAALLLAVASGMAEAAVIYSMPNGCTGNSASYWDEQCDGSGNNHLDLSPLSGGWGDLTDGLVATDQNVLDKKWVAWKRSALPVVSILFDLGSPEVISDVNVSTWVYIPNGQLLFDKLTLSFGVSSSALGNQVIIDPTTTQKSTNVVSTMTWALPSAQTARYVEADFAMPSNANWLFLSEVGFTTAAVAQTPEPSCILAMLAGLGGIAGLRRRARR